MANEITKLGFSNGQADVLFIYDLVTARTYKNSAGANVTAIPTPSAFLANYTSELGGNHTIASDAVTGTEKTAMDAGTMAFEIVKMTIPPDKPNSELLAEAQALYAIKMAEFIMKLDDFVYKKAGVRFDAT